MNFTVKQTLKLLVFINFFSTTDILAQSDDKKVSIHQSMYWINFSEKILFSPSFTGVVDFQERRFAFPDRQNQFLIKSGIQKKLENGINIGSSIGYRWQKANQPTGPIISKSNELRLTQDLSYSKALNRWIIGVQTSLDERFLRNRLIESPLKTDNFNLRSRSRLEFEFIIFGKEESENPLKAKMAEELYLNFIHTASHNFFDQNRVSCGLNYQLSPHLSMELLYYYTVQKTLLKNTVLVRNMIKLGFQHSILPRHRNQEVNN